MVSNVPGKSALKRLIGPTILVILLLSIDLKGMGALALQAHLGGIVFASLLSTSLLLSKVVRWNLLLKSQKVTIPFQRCLQIYLAANYLATITPGRVGEASKAWFIQKHTQTPLSYALSSVVLDRWFDVLLLSLGSLTLVWFSPFPALARNSLVLGTGALLLISVALVSQRFGHHLLKALNVHPALEKFHKPIQQFYEGFKHIPKPTLVFAFGLTCLAYTLITLQAFTVAKSLALPSVTYFSVCLAIFMGNMMSYLPFSVAGLGTREAAILLVFSNYPISNEHAMSFSLLFLMTSLLINIPMGYIALSQLQSLKNDNP